MATRFSEQVNNKMATLTISDNSMEQDDDNLEEDVLDGVSKLHKTHCYISIMQEVEKMSTMLSNQGVLIEQGPDTKLIILHYAIPYLPIVVPEKLPPEVLPQGGPPAQGRVQEPWKSSCFCGQYNRKFYIGSACRLDERRSNSRKEGKIDEIAEAKLYGVKDAASFWRRLLWGKFSHKFASDISVEKLQINNYSVAVHRKYTIFNGVLCRHGVYSVTLDAEQGLATISGEVDPNILLKAITNTGKHAELKWVNFKLPAPNHYAGSGYYNNVDDGYYGHGYGYDYGYGSHSGAYGPTNQSYYGGRELMPPAEGMYWDAPQSYWPQSQGWPQVSDEYYNYTPSYDYSSNYGYPPPSVKFEASASSKESCCSSCSSTDASLSSNESVVSPDERKPFLSPISLSNGSLSSFSGENRMKKPDDLARNTRIPLQIKKMQFLSIAWLSSLKENVEKCNKLKELMKKECHNVE
ncbi:hypothetical protein RHSIM_Rhsim06G0227800 [Rhododendron simsii]|uniref:Uncharacterized protein n=1 Tax=Rhododendron simsii TaxID=118357 RepID=A0A834GVK1_RHOSS|nr:hypothetical protein RHSIM_Rhsim06G0227800 [Rhododendron simsii]